LPQGERKKETEERRRRRRRGKEEAKSEAWGNENTCDR
jgi:hypothetical protein